MVADAFPGTTEVINGISGVAFTKICAESAEAVPDAFTDVTVNA